MKLRRAGESSKLEPDEDEQRYFPHPRAGESFKLEPDEDEQRKVRLRDSFKGLGRLQLSSGIPTHIWRLVIERVDSNDLINFNIAKSFGFARKHASGFPWLTTTYLDDHDRLFLCIFDIFDKKTYEVEIPELYIPDVGEDVIDYVDPIDQLLKLKALNHYRQMVCGSSVGWVTAMGNGATKKVLLVKPFNRKVVELPPTNPLIINKMIMSRSGGDVIALSVVEFAYLSYCRPGKDSSWTNIAVEKESWVSFGGTTGPSPRYNDVTFYKGRPYALRNSGEVDVIKGLHGPSPTISLFTSSDGASIQSHLVESHDYLFKILRRGDGFRVFRLDFNGRNWVEVKSLDGYSFFIGASSVSCSVFAPDFSGCEGNRIYYMIDGAFRRNFRCLGIYNVNDGTTEVISLKDQLRGRAFPLWFRFGEK